MADTRQNLTMELDPKYDDYDFPTTAPEAREGHPGHLTSVQQAQVQQLRLMLESEGYTKRLDTLTLLRFLRARKFDVNLAKQMFVACENWKKEAFKPPQAAREKFNLPEKMSLDETVPTWDTLFTEQKVKLSKYYPQYYHKTDKDGRPVYVEQLANINLKAMLDIAGYNEMLTNLAVEYERLADPRLPACSRKAGALLETCCTIMDLKGVGITNVGQVYSYLSEASTISQNYYPERLGRMYLINAPWGFSKVWGMISKLLDPVTVQKIHVLGSGYQKQLLEQVPAENLPQRFGGKCECPGGCEFSDMGPWRDPEWASPSKREKTKAAEAAEGAETLEEAVPAYTETPGKDIPIVEAEDATIPVPAKAEA